MTNTDIIEEINNLKKHVNWLIRYNENYPDERDEDKKRSDPPREDSLSEQLKRIETYLANSQNNLQSKDSVVNEITETLKNELKTHFTNFNEKLQKESSEDEKEKISSLEEDVKKLYSVNEALSTEKIAFEEIKKDEITKLQESLLREVDEKITLQRKIDDALESLEPITAEGLTLGKRVNNVFDIHKSLKQEVADLKDLLKEKEGEYQRKVSRLEDKLETEKGKVSESQGKLKETAQKFSGFDKLVIPFVELAEKVQAASSTCELLRDCSPVNGEHPDNILKFISYVGNERGFAVEIYNAMRKYQSDTKIGMEKSDRDVVRALNEFYKERDDIEFDVMVTPMEGERFNHKNVQDLEKPANTRFRDYSTVYVPAIMKDETTVSFQAVVKGKS